MSDKKYRFANGVILDTAPEVDAYTRGLEVARAAYQKTEGQESAVAALIEDAHQVKNAGPTPEVVEEPKAEEPSENPDAGEAAADKAE